MPPLLEVKSLSKQYENSSRAAVSDINFTLDEGQILSLTGESGSGKTSLLQLIAGLIDPDQGEVSLGGEKVKGPKARLVAGHPDIKMVFQHYNLSPNLTVRQNIKHILRAYVAEYKNERADELIHLCKLGDMADKYPRQLSGGEKQRVALARSIAEEPKLLLMDEPFSNLDISLKKHLKDEITEILETFSISAIIVTHDPQDALSMANQVAVMSRGKMLQHDIPQKIYRKPVNAYVAQLFGSCNILLPDQNKLFNNKSNTNQVICLRAEDLQMLNPQKDLPTATVKRVRYMGAFQDVQLEFEQQLLNVHYPQDHFKVGDQVHVSIPEDKIIYFDRAS